MSFNTDQIQPAQPKLFHSWCIYQYLTQSDTTLAVTPCPAYNAGFSSRPLADMTPKYVNYDHSWKTCFTNINNNIYSTQMILQVSSNFVTTITSNTITYKDIASLKSRKFPHYVHLVINWLSNTRLPELKFCPRAITQTSTTECSSVWYLSERICKLLW